MLVTRADGLAGKHAPLSAREGDLVLRERLVTKVTRRLHFSERQKCCLCSRRLGGDAEVVEQGLHADAEGFVVRIDAVTASG